VREWLVLLIFGIGARLFFSFRAVSLRNIQIFLSKTSSKVVRNKFCKGLDCSLNLLLLGVGNLFGLVFEGVLEGENEVGVSGVGKGYLFKGFPRGFYGLGIVVLNVHNLEENGNSSGGFTFSEAFDDLVDNVVHCVHLGVGVFEIVDIVVIIQQVGNTSNKGLIGDETSHSGCPDTDFVAFVKFEEIPKEMAILF